MTFRELPATIVGQLGEQIVAREYRRDGWGVIASYKFSGANDNEAPAIEIDDGAREITPDLDVSKGGSRIWIEVKTHERPGEAGKLRMQTHGVSVRLFNNYVAVEQRSGNPVYLAIVELATKEILITPRPLSQMIKFPCLCGCKSTEAAKRCTARPGDHRYPQWYFNREDFVVRGVVDNRAFTLLDEKHRALRDGHAYQRHGAPRSQARISGVFEYEPWTWACLPCNATGVGDSSKHRCGSTVQHAPSMSVDAARTFWLHRLTWALHGDKATAANLLERPIARLDLVKLLGPSWGIDGDNGAKLAIGKPSSKQDAP